MNDLLAAGCKVVQHTEEDRNVSPSVTSTSWLNPLVAAGYSGLNLIPQGTDYYRRIGDKVRLQRLDLRMFFEFSGERTPEVVRLVIYVNTQTDSTMPTNSNQSLLNWGTSYPTNGYNIREASKYIVLYDKLIVPDNFGAAQGYSGSVTYTDCVKCLELSFDLCDMPVTYNGPNGYSSQIVDNSINIQAICNDMQGNSGTSNTNVTYSYELYYTDF